MSENTARRALERVEAAIAMDHAAIGAANIRNLDFSDVPSSDAVRMGQIFGGYQTDSGAVVNDRTAMRVSAVYAAVRLISGSVATTPCLVYRRKKNGERERASDHPYWYLLNEEACDLFTAATFWERVTSQMLLRDVSAAYIVRANQYSTEAKALIPLRREDVTPVRLGRRLVYRISELQENGSTKYFTADAADVLHFPGFGFDGVCSMSIVQWAARQAIGTALQADSHAASMFGSGASIQYAVTMPENKTMTQDQQDLFREAWVAKYATGRGISQIPLVLTEGLDVKELSMTAADAQLIESRQFNVVDIARAIGVPPHMIGATEKTSSWGTGVEQMSIGYVKYGLLPHLNRFVQELNRKLFARSSRFFFEFNVDAQMEGDSKAQAEYFSKALGGPGAQGWMAPNEVRALKNLKKIKGGDKLAIAGAAPANDPNKPKDPANPNNPDDPSETKPEGEDDE